MDFWIVKQAVDETEAGLCLNQTHEKTKGKELFPRMSDTSKEPTRNDEKSAMHKSDRKSSNAVIYVLGVGIIAAAALIAVLGGRSMIDAMNRNADAEIASIQETIENQIMQEASEKIEAAEAEAEEASKALEEEQSKYTNDQIQWMQENHIHWNEDGNPEDEDGNIVDDPTTDVNEVERAKALEETPETEPEAAEDWWKDNPAITQDEDGNLVHIVERGETLGDIAAAVGYSTSELAEYNGLSNPSLIVTGQTIKIPPEDPNAGLDGITPDMIGLG